MKFPSLCGVLIAISITAPICAHDPGMSSAHVRILRDSAVGVVAFNNSDFVGLVAEADRNGDGQVSRSELKDIELVRLRFLAEEIRLGIAGSVVQLVSVSVELGERDDVRLMLTWDFSSVISAGSMVTWSDDLLIEFPRGHRQYVLLTDASGATLAESLLTTSERIVTVAAKVGPSVGGASFLHLGIEHILIGYDHILFLIGLLLACSRLTQVLATITAFTVAHSLTLASAALGVVRLPGTFVEATIALSIIYVGVENFSRRGAVRERSPWKVTFVFGLIHGFGFASVLADLGIGGRGVEETVVPLLAFNAGVELGQLMIAATVLPALWYLGRKFGRRVMIIGSAAICVAGAFWFVERAIL